MKIHSLCMVVSFNSTDVLSCTLRLESSSVKSKKKKKKGIMNSFSNEKQTLSLESACTLAHSLWERDKTSDSCAQGDNTSGCLFQDCHNLKVRDICDKLIASLTGWEISVELWWGESLIYYPEGVHTEINVFFNIHLHNVWWGEEIDVLPLA